MKGLVILLVILSVIYAYAAKGDIVGEFTLEGQPTGGVRGLAYDPADGNIWAAGPNDINDVIFAKFTNDTNHSIVQNWQKIQSQYWVYDIGYKYVYSGKDCIVVCCKPDPRIRLHDKSDGSYIGSLPDAFSGGYNEGIEGDYKNNWGVTLYCDNYNYTTVKKWNGSSWSDWATCTSPAMGCAFGWNHVFVIHTSSVYSIRVFRTSDGLKVEDIPLKNWGTKYMAGLSRSRENYNGTDETLYTAVFYPSNVIYEIDIGQYTGGPYIVETTSVGGIKALFH